MAKHKVQKAEQQNGTRVKGASAKSKRLGQPRKQTEWMQRREGEAMSMLFGARQILTCISHGSIAGLAMRTLIADLEKHKDSIGRARYWGFEDSDLPF